MSSGRIYAEEVTVVTRNVNPDFAILRPLAAADDPKNGIYTTWAAAHAAALALPVPMRGLYIDAPATTVTITPGEWDMDNMPIVGYPDPGGATAKQQITTAPAGVTFLNFYHGTENCVLNHAGNAALFTPAANAPNALRMRTGKNAYWMSSGTAVIVGFTGTGGLFVDVEDGTSIVGDAIGTFEVFGVAVGATLALYLYDNVTVSVNSIRGAGTLERHYYGIGPEVLAQGALSGPNQTFGGSDGLEYTPGTPAIWTDPDPTRVKQALDRMATALAGLLGGGVIP